MPYVTYGHDHTKNNICDKSISTENVTRMKNISYFIKYCKHFNR